MKPHAGIVFQNGFLWGFLDQAEPFDVEQDVFAVKLLKPSLNLEPLTYSARSHADFRSRCRRMSSATTPPSARARRLKLKNLLHLPRPTKSLRCTVVFGVHGVGFRHCP